ncbi:hypothetical protein ACHAPT_009611 [Fusarium lateritium]
MEQEDATKIPLPSPPHVLTYKAIPGSWARKKYPHWPDHVFRLPEKQAEGEIYYTSKGDLLRMGRTALVELLPSGHIAKTPKPNPYWPVEERENRQDMEHEASIYRRLGASSFIPEFISWDPESCSLTLKNYPNGDLESYIREPDYNSRAGVEIRKRWALQAAKALAVIHAAELTHNDIAPRNFLLDEDLNLRICDFAGCSLPGGTSSYCAPGARYESRPWSRDYTPTQADDVFALGSVIYFIMNGEEPYRELDDEEVEQRFENKDFPASSHHECGTVIQDCWTGRLTTAEQVVQALGC